MSEHATGCPGGPETARLMAQLAGEIFTVLAGRDSDMSILALAMVLQLLPGERENPGFARKLLAQLASPEGTSYVLGVGQKVADEIDRAPDRSN